MVAMQGLTFELNTPHGRMTTTLLAGIAQFERDLLSERVKSGLAAARRRGKKLGRQKGQRPVSDKVAPKVIQAAKEGRSYRWVARDLGICKTTVLNIMKRHRGNPKRDIPPFPLIDPKLSTADAEAILRRFTRGQTHPVFSALLELGKAVKTIF